MKKLVTLISFSAILFACNNSTDATTTTTTPADADTVNRATIPPPVSLDTPATTTDTAKVKRAIRK